MGNFNEHLRAYMHIRQFWRVARQTDKSQEDKAESLANFMDADECAKKALAKLRKK